MKHFALLALVLVLVGVPSIGYADGCSTTGVKCKYVQNYSESVGSRRKVTQYTHLVGPNSVSSSVSYTVSTTQTLSLKTGVSGNVNFLLANSSVNFEMGSLGSREIEEKVTWESIPAGEKHLLRAGRTFITVTGYKKITDTDCKRRTEKTVVDGSTGSWHDSIKQ